MKIFLIFVPFSLLISCTKSELAEEDELQPPVPVPLKDQNVEPLPEPPNPRDNIQKLGFIDPDTISSLPSDADMNTVVPPPVENNFIPEQPAETGIKATPPSATPPAIDGGSIN